MPNDVTLGAALATLMQELSDSVDRTPDKAQRAQLLAKQDQVHAQLQPLIDKTIKQNLAEYRQATAAVNQAIAALKATQQDIARVAKAIEMLAQVVGALAKLAAAV
jgi:hypothetical protein